MVEILPGMNIQSLLPSRYTLSRYGQLYSYPLNYEFNSQGLPIRRTTSAGEVTTYEYYWANKDRITRKCPALHRKFFIYSLCLNSE